MTATREAMLDSAIVLFRERGIAATSLRDVVAHSGAPRGSIYHHFPGGKAELARDATRRAADLMLHNLASLVESGDPVAAVDRMVGGWTRLLTDSDFTRSCPVAAAALADADLDASRAEAASAFTRWQALLAEALRAEGVADARADSLAVMAISAIEGAIVLARARRDVAPLRDVGRELAVLFRAAAAADDGPGGRAI